ncbi:CorA family divalent cation transporter [Roseovarius sp. MMSF_3281]|uniref:CorA family divalent cation transporter n=1 Tax=Roseovarius sp. MMSF_3281 TaxID=3046694 RepID=UPI00273F156E|nr:CorA family divalent cation transporter [Roseovarius sp. MMSF_3281]
MQTITILDIAPDGSVQPAALESPLPTSGYRWIDSGPDNPDVTAWCGQNLDPVATEALLAPETRPRAMAIGQGTLILMRGVNLNPEEHVDDMISVRCWMARGLIISLRHRTSYTLRDIHAKVDNGKAPEGPLAFTCQLAEGLIDRIESVSIALEDSVDDLEAAIFEEHTTTRSEHTRLAGLRRRAIRLRRYMGPMATALHDLGRLLPDTGEDKEAAKARLHETANRATRSVEEQDAARDRLTALADHIDMQQAARQQNNGYILSLVAAIFLPLGFITGLFGVNVAGMPGTQNDHAFWILTCGSLAISLALVIFLYWKRWF